jgi:hypothetical protein
MLTNVQAAIELFNSEKVKYVIHAVITSFQGSFWNLKNGCINGNLVKSQTFAHLLRAPSLEAAARSFCGIDNLK